MPEGGPIRISQNSKKYFGSHTFCVTTISMNNNMSNKRDAFYAIIEFSDGFTSAKHEIQKILHFYSLTE